VVGKAFSDSETTFTNVLNSLVKMSLSFIESPLSFTSLETHLSLARIQPNPNYSLCTTCYDKDLIKERVN
jgi:hypothetical protein